MIFSGDFYYYGLLRWNLGWPTPNYAGAFVAMLLTLAFTFSGSRWRWAALAVEAGGLFLLAKTYSRGAVVAWVAAWVFAVVAGRVWRKRQEILLWGLRAAVLGLMLLAVGFGWSRAGRAAVSQDGDGAHNTGGTPLLRSGRASASDGPARDQDGSIVNRLALWRGGAMMIAAAPWAGWGAGESGRIYMNWFQEVDRPEGFSTMVNSFLHVGVEYGLGALAAVVAGLGALLALAWQVGRAEGGHSGGVVGSMRVTAAGASLVAWAVANVFTTLWIDWKLWIVPGVAVGIIVWDACRGTGILPVGLPLRRAMLFGAAAALGATFGLFFTGRVIAARSSLLIEPAADGALHVRSAGVAFNAKAAWHVWPDTTILGPTPGNSLRRWLAATPQPPLLVIHRADEPVLGTDSGDATGVMLFGRQAERLTEFGQRDGRRLRVVHPLGAPPPAPENSFGKIELILPAIDEAGNNPAWRAWAAATRAQVIESAGTGLDIRAAWPAVMLHGGGR
jgi:hypothetical protein